MAEAAYSPGLEGVVAGETAISDLESGLSYRGYAVEELAERASYEEAAYLVLYGELPTASQLSAFRSRLAGYAAVPAPVIAAVRQIPAGAPMMDVMRSGASLLGHFDPDLRSNDREANFRKAERLLAQLPVVLAARHRLLEGKEPIAPEPGLGFAANILYMLRGTKPSADHARALDVTLVLYTEHGFNASTFTARVCVSTLSDIHSGVTAAIGALKGPLHGGANERAIEVLLAVGGSAKAEKWVRDALARKERLMGFGHRVYKDGDPRATLLKSWCVKLAKETGHEDMERSAEVIEGIVKAEKKLPANVDWPCGRVYYYLGLPVEMYTPLFVVGRTAGWAAHIIEQLSNNRIIRPDAIYTGPAPRKFVPLEGR